ncbi:MAG: MFS transporter [Gaiellales bacterium]
MRELLRDRNARLLLSGQALSLLGDRAMYLALGVWVKSLTGSSAAAGLVFFCLGLPGLAAPAAGLVVDRVRRRRLMIIADLAIALILLSLLLVHGRDQLWLIYAVTLAYGASAIVFGSAQSALLTEILPGKLLPPANALLQTASEGMRLVAPLFGAALFAWVGGGAVAVLDAGSFVASAVCLSLLHHRDARPAPQEHHLREQLIAGARHIARTPQLLRIVVTVAVALLVVGFAETLIFSVIDVGLHRPPSFLGVLSALQGVGAIAGALAAPGIMRRMGDGRLVAGGLALFAVGDSLLIVPRLGLVLLGMTIAGAGISWAVVGFGSAIQLRTPPDLQGRAYSAADMLLSVPSVFSIAAGASLSTVIDYRVLLAAMGIVTAATGGYLALTSEPADAGPQYTHADAELAGALDPDPGGSPRA